MTKGIISLEGKRGLVFGVANDQSIAYACAKVLHQAGAQVGLTYQNEKTKKFTQHIADELEAPLFLECNVEEPGHLEKIFADAEKLWGGQIDFVIHSIAFAPHDDLHGRVVDCSKEGFDLAMNISCHSFIRMAKLAEPLMKDGGTLITMSYYGAEKVVENYNVMGPVKAALESVTRYLAAELGPQGIRVHDVSPGPLPTRAGSGIDHFNDLMKSAEERSPLRHLARKEDVGALVALLVSEHGQSMTGNSIFVDSGYNIMG